MRLRRILALAGLAMFVSACTPMLNARGPAIQPAEMRADAFVVEDGAILPYRHWPADGDRPRAVILALHGFNDHSRAWELPAAAWAARGIALYAYDQRGFGRAPQPGIWAGSDALVADLASVQALVKNRYPSVPVFLAGESMGGAVVMAALARGAVPTQPGAVLTAPAVRERASLNWFERTGLDLLYATVPGWAPSVQASGIVPSDNVPMMRALSADPLFLKRTRVDALKGLFDLMDESSAAAPKLGGPLLVLVGANDTLIPGDPMARMIATLPAAPPADRQVVEYPRGFHMLLRDMNRARVHDDVAAWILARSAPQ
jgi:alpha-beta hydrolase superfamily lysophospholipase